jgi:hypothetical protein
MVFGFQAQISDSLVQRTAKSAYSAALKLLKMNYWHYLVR